MMEEKDKLNENLMIVNGLSAVLLFVFVLVWVWFGMNNLLFKLLITSGLVFLITGVLIDKKK